MTAMLRLGPSTSIILTTREVRLEKLAIALLAVVAEYRLLGRETGA